MCCTMINRSHAHRASACADIHPDTVSECCCFSQMGLEQKKELLECRLEAIKKSMHEKK